MKKCSKCNITKNLTEFYIRKDRKCGYDSACKECTKAKSSLISKNKGILNEDIKKRKRQLYHIKGYVKKDTTTESIRIKKYRSKYPEKIKAHIAIRTLIKQIKSNHLHHWSYNPQHYLDVIELSRTEHNKLHRYITYDNNTFMYKDRKGNLLDTRQKHIDYYNTLTNLD